MYATGDERCHVATYKLYARYHPPHLCKDNDKLYLQANSAFHKSGLWFNNQPVGQNKISSMMKKMVKRERIAKRQAAYQYKCEKTFVDETVTQIFQIAGHKMELQ